MDESHLPERRQPQILQGNSEAAPSLRLYAGLCMLAFLLIALSFGVHRDWAGLGINLATEILGAVIILIVVDRRIRSAEVSAILGIPTATGRLVWLGGSRSHRRLSRFCSVFVLALRAHLPTAVRVGTYDLMEQRLSSGFALRGGPGTGKTLLVQMAATEIGRRHLANPVGNPAPLLFPASSWSNERGLEEAFRSFISGFVPASKRDVTRWLKRGQLTVLVDGIHEAGAAAALLVDQIQRLKVAYPKVVWILSYRPTIPDPAGFDVIEVAPPTAEESGRIHALMDAFVREHAWPV